MIPSGPYMTLEDAAKWFAVNEHTLSDAIKQGQVQGVRRVGTRVFINKIAIILKDLDTDLGTLAKQLGVTNIDELFAFLDGTGSSHTAEKER